MENTQQAEQFLTAIQSFTDQGRYIEAAERVQSTEARTALGTKRVALELAEVFGQQGYYGKAVRTLEQHVTDPEVVSLHNIVGMRLQMVLLSFKAQRLHDFKGLGGIRQRVLSLEDIISSLISCDNYLDEDVVRTVEGYCQLMQWISEFNRPLPKEAMERVFVWVKRALDANISHSQFRLAVILLRAYTAGATSRLAKLYGLDMDECKEAMQRLVDAPAIPNLLKAKVFHLLAWITDPEDKALGESYEVKAVELYKESCSTTGEVGIRVSRVCHDMSSGNMDLVEGGNRLEGLLQQLEDQDYLAGRFKALEIMQAKLTGREFFELQLSLIDTAQTLAEQAEAPVLAMIFKLRAISHWYIRGGHTPRVIEFGKGLYNALDEVDCAWFKGAVANIVALAYIPLNDHQNAIEWSKHSEHLWMSCSVTDGAGAVETQLLADVQACSTWTEQEFDAAVAKWTTVIDHEAEQGLTEDVVKKMGHLTDALMKRRDPRTNNLLERWEKLLSQQPPTPSAKAIDFKLAASCLGTVKSLLSPSSQGSWSPQLVAQCINLAQKARRLYQKHKNITEDAKALSVQATLMFYASQRYSSEDLLRASIETMDTTVEAFRLLDSKAMVSSATYWRAVFAFHQNGSAEAVMQYLLEAETARNDERVEVAMLGRLDGLTQKQRMAADPSNLKIFEMAFQLCRREGWVEQLWEWLQKSKARSLSDLLGLRALIPGYLRAEIMADPEANRLFVQEEALLQAIAQSQAAKRLPLRNQLHLLQQQWRQYSVLDSVTAIRNATPASLEQLRSWFARTPELQDLGPLVFADWLFIEDDIFLLTVRPDSVAPQLAKCPISRAEINKWALRFAKGQGDDDEEYDYDFTREEWDDDDPDYALRHLDALILPLGQVSAPEDLIVLSTTGILHSIPLHALWIDEEPLITRNPVVYAANMTSFMQCFRRSVNFPPQAESTPMTIMAVYEPGGGRAFSPAEQSAVYSAASNLGSITGARVFSDQAANKQHFSNALETSTIFHFHGHCVLRPELLTDQALVLAQGEEVSVSDIFGLTLDTASHITLVACESAVQGVAKADEPLGLVTALLCAGAGSVLGTLWPIASMPGRLFAELFYADVLRQIQEGAGRYGVVDLAKTLRKVVLDLRTDKRTRKPYYWAPFVLHGSPVLRQPSS